MEVDFVTLLMSLMDRLEVHELQKMVTVGRYIWLRRNKFVFEGEFQSPSLILNMATT